MTGLGSAVHHESNVAADGAEQCLHRAFIPDVDGEVTKSGKRGGERIRVPVDGAILAEEIGAQIVVDTDDVESGCVEEPHGLAADESGRAGDDNGAHGSLMRSHSRGAPGWPAPRSRRHPRWFQAGGWAASPDDP